MILRADKKINKHSNLFSFQFVLDNLSGNADYVLRICAATKSLSNPNKTWLGEPSVEKLVFLPEDKCDQGRASFYIIELLIRP